MASNAELWWYFVVIPNISTNSWVASESNVLTLMLSHPDGIPNAYSYMRILVPEAGISGMDK